MTDCEVVYRLPDSVRIQRWLLLLTGLLVGVGVTVWMVLGITHRVGESDWNILAVGGVLLAIRCLYTAHALAMNPQEVGVGPRGVRVVRQDQAQFIPWDELGWSEVWPASVKYPRMFLLYGVDGTRSLRITDAMPGFDVMVHSIQQYITAREAPATETIHIRKSRKSAWLRGVCGVLLVVMAFVGARVVQVRQREFRLLSERGARGTAQVTRLFLATDQVTPRMDYRVVSPEESSTTRNVEVDRSVWDRLTVGNTFPVIFVRGEPEISRVPAGLGVREPSSIADRVGYLGPLVLAVVGLMSLVSAALNWRGLTFHRDPRSGRISIREYGQGP